MSWRDGSKQLSAFVGVGMFALVAATIFEPVGTARQVMSYWYEPVAGRVVKIVPETDEEPPVVEYSYVVDGQRCFSERFSWIERDVDSEFDAVAGGAAAGDRITVYVHSRHRDRSVLVRGLSRTAAFLLGWFCIPCLGFAIVWERYRAARKPQEKYHRGFADRVEVVGQQLRLRMVPGNLTPLSAGIACFVTMAVITFLVAVGGRWAQWWNVSIPLAGLIAVLAGTATGVFDYFYTLRGNQRGRWDLIIDRQRGTLQVPALGAYGQPTTVALDEIVGFSIDPLVPVADDEDYMPPQVLKLQTQDGHRTCNYRVFASRSESELAALADWIWQAAELPPPSAPHDGKLVAAS